MRHNRRLKRLIRSGFTGKPSGYFFGTLTAPGVAGGIPFDTTACTHRRGRPCSGKLGCRADTMAAALWNSAAPQAWSWFVTQLRRELPHVDLQFWACWEAQKRGLLHRHAIIRARYRDSGRPVPHYALEAAWKRALLHRYAIKCNGVPTGEVFAWGTEWTLDRIGSSRSVGELIEMLDMDPDEATATVAVEHEREVVRFVRYGAKYCTKGGQRAITLKRDTGEIKMDGTGYRTWSSSQMWGRTMASIRDEQRAWAIANRDGASAAQATQSPSSRGAVGAAGGSGAAALDPDTETYATWSAGGLSMPSGDTVTAG